MLENLFQTPFMHRARWCARSAAALLALAMVALLQACSVAQPSWIEAPLVADGSSTGAGYAPHGTRLPVGEGASAQLKFSYATLPNGVLTKLNVDTDNTVATVGQDSYALDAGKVVRARLVLYVDKVTAPGYIAIFGAYQAGGADCFAHEGTAPACPQQVASAAGGRATDADRPAQPLRITERGFYSFDVTELVKHRLAQGVESMLRVEAAQDTDGSYGSFEFASREQPVGQARVLHQAQLLITLEGLAGISGSPYASNSVRQSSTDPAVADQDFRLDENLWLGGAAGDRAYALLQPQPLEIGFPLRQVLFSTGSMAGKQSLVMHVNGPLLDQTTPQPQVQVYGRHRFNVSGQVVRSWNDGWAEPPGADLIATAALDRSAPRQTVIADTTDRYIDTLASAYNGNRNQDFAVAVTTNLQSPVTLDSTRNTGTGHAPRFVTVIKPEKDVWRSPFDFDKDDSTQTLSLCLQFTGSAGTCHSTLSLRARLGQLFTRQGHAIVIGPWADTVGGGHVPYVADIDLALPQSGASADVPADLGAQSLSGDMGSYIGYGIRQARANRVVGTYRGIVSMAGHNLRTAIDFENLPLPVPALSGPASVETAPGTSVAAVAAGAPQPFVLAVADPVGQNIDDTTRWVITSSNPADTLPGDIQQSDGSVPFAVTFSGVGARTLTATSRGDAGITATLAVNVLQGAQLGQSISFTSAPAAFAKVGGAYLAAATGGGSGLPVIFSLDAAGSTPGACTVAANGAVAFTGAGTCAIRADQAGNAAYTAAAPVRQSFTIGAESFAGTTVPTSGGGSAGAASASLSGGGPTCQFDAAATRFTAASAAPPGQGAPQGMFDFRLVGCTPGATVTITTHWPQPVTGFAKYGKATRHAASASFFAPTQLVISGSTVRFDVTDGQLGDDDWTADGVILDPVMPLAAALGAAHAIPTLDEWALLLLSLLVGALAWRQARV
ncbi:IPTL-CTERM sorting domain-containing protein [Paracidovorax sp. MALMAid1276]|uniref:IPTL-CTERM sorting domain-containing protein n=1 Tax=Paracidovorax sp. MALMAid1276 TaxID=3411631 RepID=UPI003B9B37B8